MAAEHEMVAPTPRSPPKYPDFGGRRRLQLEVQNLNREVGFLEEEVHSLEGLQPASRCCKEVHEFVGTNPDPLIPLNKNSHRSCNFWRWLGRSKLCSTFSWFCCCTGCCDQCKCPSCTCCPNPKKLCCCNCLRCCCPQTFSSCRWPCSNCCPKACRSCPKFSCFSKSPCCCCCCCSWDFSCCRFPKCCCSGGSCSKLAKCCCPPTISCPEYSCGCVLDCPKCTEVHLCPKCSKPCCVTGCLC